MRFSKVASFVFAAFLTGMVVTPASAQTPVQANENQWLAAAGVTFANQYSRTGVGVGGNILFNALTSTSSGKIGIVGDVAFTNFNFGWQTTLMGGARYTYTAKPDSRIKPYGQFLIGYLGDGIANLGEAIGGGADIGWKNDVNFRAEMAFVLRDNANGVRFFFGVSTPIKKKL